MIIRFENVDSIEEIWRHACDICRAEPCFNLLLAYEFAIEQTSSKFVSLHGEKAGEWQREEPPEQFFFSHGQYFRGEKGIQHVISELKGKSASRRAILSLVGMDDILGRGDEPVPSFMVLQFAIDGSVLYTTAYFRALEVTTFLRINLTEICLIVRRISAEFQALRRVRLSLLAFRAYADDGFILERAEMDIQRPGTVAGTVVQRNYVQLIEWLRDKKRRRSRVELGGLLELDNALERFAPDYPPRFRANVRELITSAEALRELRQRASESDQIEREQTRYDSVLDACVRELEGLAK